MLRMRHVHISLLIVLRMRKNKKKLTFGHYGRKSLEFQLRKNPL